MPDTEILDAQPTRENPAPQPTRERVTRNPVANQLGTRSKKPNECKRKLDTPNASSQGFFVPQH